MTVLERISAETPKFFKGVITLALTVAGVAAAILTAGTTIVLPLIVTQICQYLVVAGTVAAMVSKVTVVSTTTPTA